jgi:hypothetical protein
VLIMEIARCWSDLLGAGLSPQQASSAIDMALGYGRLAAGNQENGSEAAAGRRNIKEAIVAGVISQEVGWTLLVLTTADQNSVFWVQWEELQARLTK